MSSSRRPSFFHLSTWLPLPALALAAPARLEMDKLHAQTPPTAYAETSGGQRLLLWGVLLLGAACMAFMAVQLLRKPKE